MTRRTTAGLARLTVAGLTVAGLTLTGLTACTGSTSASPAPVAVNPVLTRTIETLDAATSVRFTIVGREVPGGLGVSRLLRGHGVLARPTPATTAYRGTMEMLINEEKTSFDMISFRDTFYIRVHGATRYQVSDRVSFGTRDPATLIRRKAGLEQLLDGMRSVQDQGVSEVDGVRVRTLQGEITGLLANRVLPIANVYEPVRLRLTVEESTALPRTATITGFFFPGARPSSYTLTLSRWNEKVTVTSPKA